MNEYKIVWPNYKSEIQEIWIKITWISTLLHGPSPENIHKVLIYENQKFFFQVKRYKNAR